MITPATLAFTETDAGYEFFDTTLNKPLYLKVVDNGQGANPRYVYSWVDATGATV